MHARAAFALFLSVRKNTLRNGDCKDGYSFSFSALRQSFIVKCLR